MWQKMKSDNPWWPKFMSLECYNNGSEESMLVLLQNCKQVHTGKLPGVEPLLIESLDTRYIFNSRSLRSSLLAQKPATPTTQHFLHKSLIHKNQPHQKNSLFSSTYWSWQHDTKIIPTTKMYSGNAKLWNISTTLNKYSISLRQLRYKVVLWVHVAS